MPTFIFNPSCCFAVLYCSNCSISSIGSNDLYDSIRFDYSDDSIDSINPITSNDSNGSFCSTDSCYSTGSNGSADSSGSNDPAYFICSVGSCDFGNYIDPIDSIGVAKATLPANPELLLFQQKNVTQDIHKTYS